MASISKQANGRRTIQFVVGDGRRRSIRLGKMSHRKAEVIKARIEQLNATNIAGQALDADTARWVADLEEYLAAKLARAGLIPQRKTATLAAFVDSYISGRNDVKRATLTVWGHTRRNLVEFFGDDKPLREINRGDTDDWKQWLIDTGLGHNTTTKRYQFANQFFRSAKRHRLIDENPFSHLKGKVTAAEKHFVTPDEAVRVLDACPDLQWRTIFALCRYAGLRCPSEVLALRWQDVDWANDRFTVHSPKTEHHAGKASRIVPIFPELRPHLDELFGLAEPGADYVITRYRSTEANLRTQLHRIIRRANLEPWPSAFNSLRSTRQTELKEVYPRHVVCAWLGNSSPIADKHYLQVTDEHFQKAVQNPVQQPAVSPRTGTQSSRPAQTKTPVLQGSASKCDEVHFCEVEDRGLEPLTFWLPARRSPN